MPILNLNNPAFISVTGAGRPNSGGSVAVYAADGLFTTLATIYSDQQKTTPLTNPVTLDDAGAIEIWYEVKVDIQERLPDGTAFRDTLNLDPNAGDAVIQGFNLVDNGSFEVESLSDGQPDNWTITPYAGSAIAITETIVRNGKKALEFNTTAVGTGGGVATSVKFPVTEGSICSVAFSFYATHATTLNTFKINWYDQDDVLKSTSTVTMPASGSVPTSWTDYAEDITVDAAGTQGEVELTGISSGGANLTSKAYFDGAIVTNANLATLDTTQTLTTKTLTSPDINGGTLDEVSMTVPAFRATSSSSGLLPTSLTKWSYDGEVFDKTSDYDPVTNHRFTPSEAGVYFAYAILDADSVTTAGELIMSIYKNGTIYLTKYNQLSANGSGDVLGTVELNGTTDYIEIYVANLGLGAGTSASGAPGREYFTAFKVSA